MNCSLTLNFDSLEQLHGWASQFAKPLMTAAEISAADRPDAGAPEVQQPAANPFAAAEVQPAPETVFANAVLAPASLVPAFAEVGIAAAAPAAVPPAPGGAEVDAKGLPWDGRIHGSTKTKNADGTWRQKRGLNDEALKNRIEGELRAAMAARAPAAAAPVAAPAASMVTPLVLPNVPAAPILPAASAVPAVVPAAPVLSPAVPAAPATVGETFGQLMARLAPITTGNPAKAEKVNQALGMFGLTALSQLPARPDLLPAFASTVDAMLAAA